jgi:hypothetical protein
MIMSLVLILLGVLCRVVEHPPNAVAIGAIALYAGAKLPRRWAWIVPIAAMVLSDLILDWGHADRPVFTVSRATIYGTYAAITLLGLLARRAKGWSAPLSLGVLSLSASGLFFLTTNFAEWIAGPLGLYPHTWEGLVACYVAAIPFTDHSFFHNTLLADLAGTGILFGLDALAHRVAAGRQVHPAPAEEIGLAEA